MEFAEYDIDTLIVRKLSGQISAEEDQWLMLRVNTDPKARENFESVREIWESANDLRVKGALTVEQRFTKLNDRIQEEQRKSRFSVLKYAAVLAVFVLAGIGYWMTRQEVPLRMSGVAGSVKTISLPDGSAVTLNGASTITYFPESFPEDRKITVEGEAFFQVTHNGIPFVVNTQQASIRVLGTSFNVASAGAQTHVGCVTGKVRVNLSDKKDAYVDLTQGMGVSAGTTLSEVITINEVDLIAWVHGELLFKENKLRDVFATLEKRFGKRIEYPVTLPDVAFSGKFKKPQLEDVLNTICLSAGLTYRVNADSVFIVREK